MEEQPRFEKESKNYVNVQLKKSSSKDGGMGWEIEAQSDGSITKEQLEKIAEDVLNTAMKTELALRKAKGV